MIDRPRVRFAPSPTGPLHIGGVRTALYNYLFAKQNNGTFILRIEDTDQARYVEGAEAYIKESLEWLGLTADEGPDQGGSFGPYRQSERRDIYTKYVQDLIDAGKAYYAFDTPDEIEAMRARENAKGNQGPKYDQRIRKEMRNTITLGDTKAKELVAAGVPYTVRLWVPEEGVIRFEDRIRGQVQFDVEELDDKVILKTDGLPTYHLANVVDDFLMKISHVIRGEEWLSSTAHHVLLYQSFGWSEHMPEFAHLPLILKPTGKGKLSKRDGQKFGFPVFPLAWNGAEGDSFQGFKSYGFDPAAVINFLAFLGWNPGTEQEIFSLSELTDTFSLDQISKSGARFDYDKAKWYNSQYIMAQTDEQLAQNVSPFFSEEDHKKIESKLASIAGLLKPRIQTYTEFPEAAAYFFSEVETYNEKIIQKKWKGDIKTKYQKLLHEIAALTSFEAAGIKDVVSGFVDSQGLKFGDVLPLLRIGLSGDTKGPDLFAIMEIMGKSITVQRLNGAIEVFDRIIGD